MSCPPCISFYYAPSGIALKGHFYLGVLGTQQQAVAVVGETAGASVVVAFLQHVARTVQLVVRLPSAGAYHAGHPARAVAQVFSFQAVETVSSTTWPSPSSPKA